MDEDRSQARELSLAFCQTQGSGRYRQAPGDSSSPGSFSPTEVFMKQICSRCNVCVLLPRERLPCHLWEALPLEHALSLSNQDYMFA